MARDPDIFEFDRSHPDAAAVADRIRRRVDDAIAEGLFDDARIAIAERSNLSSIDSEDEYIMFYLRCLQANSQVDINDFEIPAGGTAGKLMRPVKKIVWKMQKFMTYRLWSQQNTINGNTAMAFQSLFGRYEEKIEQLEKRIRELEGRGTEDSGAP